MPIIYVKDAVDAMVKSYENIERIESRIFNVGSIHPSPTARELAAVIRRFIPEADLRGLRHNSSVT
jgi:nucleoside-diphosphate-sugar epimerase